MRLKYYEQMMNPIKRQITLFKENQKDFQRSGIKSERLKYDEQMINPIKRQITLFKENQKYFQRFFLICVTIINKTRLVLLYYHYNFEHLKSYL